MVASRSQIITSSILEIRNMAATPTNHSLDPEHVLPLNSKRSLNSESYEEEGLLQQLGLDLDIDQPIHENSSPFVLGWAT